jgi:hypothetical protein
MARSERTDEEAGGLGEGEQLYATKIIFNPK